MNWIVKIKLQSIINLNFVFLLSNAAAWKPRERSFDCNGVIFNDIYYDKELLFNSMGRPNNLFIHKFSNVLFFSRTILRGQDLDFGIRACSINTRECFDVKGFMGGYAIGYDSGNDDIFFGGHSGIYKYNFLTRKGTFFSEHGASIWGIFIRKKFYYIRYPNQRLYVYQYDDFVEVSESRNFEIDNFFISRTKNVYFSNRTALYKVDKPSNDPYILNDDVIIRQIVEHSHGDLFFCGNDGIYLEDKPYSRLKKVAHINNTYGMAFDHHDNTVIADTDVIFRLVPSNMSEYCYKKSIRRRNRDFSKRRFSKFGKNEY